MDDVLEGDLGAWDVDRPEKSGDAVALGDVLSCDQHADQDADLGGDLGDIQDAVQV